MPLQTNGNCWSLVNLPSGHAEHKACPVRLEKRPVSHVLQVPRAIKALYFPTGHGVHELLPSAENFPAGQGLQLPCPGLV